MTTNEDRLVYDLEYAAFEGTPLGDRMDRHSLIHDVHEIVDHCFHLTGDITVEEGHVRMTRTAGYAQGQRIVFAPNRLGRYVAGHEVAHVVHRRVKTGGTSHGPEWRAVYAEMTSIVYGERYGRLLREAFMSASLPVHATLLPHPPKPIIDIDVLARASQEVRWL